MKLALISDVHSNLPALDAVLSELRRLGITRIIHAGDVVGYNAFPNEVVAAFVHSGIYSIRGNHDSACVARNFDGMNPLGAEAGEWTSRNLSAQGRDYLKGLEERLAFNAGGLRLAVHHGSPSDPNEYIMERAASSDLLRKAGADILILGHTHWPYVVRCGKGFVVNPGSVGQPRDGDWRASFATLDIENGAVKDASVHRVEYSVRVAMRAGIKAGLPQRLADRLKKGI